MKLHTTDRDKRVDEIEFRSYIVEHIGLKEAEILCAFAWTHAGSEDVYMQSLSYFCRGLALEGPEFVLFVLEIAKKPIGEQATALEEAMSRKAPFV